MSHEVSLGSICFDQSAMTRSRKPWKLIASLSILTDGPTRQLLPVLDQATDPLVQVASKDVDIVSS